jgi:hypothetical protein
MRPLKKIFIAGTGRSGTSLLYDILTTHPTAFAVPIESKFIVEGDGLNVLIPQLTENYSIFSSNLALTRFAEMMDVDYSPDGRYTASKESLKLHERFEHRFYFPPLRRYIDALTDFHLANYRFPKRFGERAEDRRALIALTREFVETLFGMPALAAGKDFWVEKTPLNIIAMDLLWDLFPEATIVHIKRHPLGVLHSFLRQDWMPKDPRNCTDLLAHIYWQWSILKPRLNFANRSYIEIKLEDLAASESETMAEIATTAGISSEFAQNCAKGELVENWQTEMPREWRTHGEKILAPYFDLMGYSR